MNAFAVASEPYIFWRGEGAIDIIRRIQIPPELGQLVPADSQFNGPSGKALDDLFLAPLGFTREDAWLCDLVPHSCVNPGQQAAIKRAYQTVIGKYSLPEPSVPPVPVVLADDDRREAILAELRDSKARLVVLLGDQPIRWFLRSFDSRWNRLSDFGTSHETYGHRHGADLDGLEIEVLPLAHPRQVAKLGNSSGKWFNLHERWVNDRRQ